MLLGCSLQGCGDGCLSGPQPAGVAEPLPAGFELYRAAVEAMAGVSGLTADGSGTLWAVSERPPQLLALAYEGDKLTLGGPPLPLTGLDPELEAEAIAAIGDHEFVVGTERVGKRSSDQLLWIKVSRGRARVVNVIAIPYGLWAMAAKDNQGIEGVCFAAGRLVVAVEAVLRQETKRYAPIAVYDVAAGTWRAARLALSTRRGKISGLACAKRGQDRIDVLAIERHFGIARLLRFSIPGALLKAQSPEPMTLTAKVQLDLHPFVKPLPNFEGLALRGNRMFVVTDNHYQTVTGPTYLLSGPSGLR